MLPRDIGAEVLFLQLVTRFFGWNGSEPSLFRDTAERGLPPRLEKAASLLPRGKEVNRRQARFCSLSGSFGTRIAV